MVSFKTVFACASLAIGAMAAAGNILVNPILGQVVNAGDKFTITWTPSGNENVNLILRKGDSASLSIVGTIATDIDNSGKYEWSVDKSLSSGTDYAIEIQNTNNIAESNYSPYFTVLAEGQGITSSAVKKAVSSTDSASAASATDASSATTSAATSSMTSGSASAASTNASGSESATGSATESATGSATGSETSSTRSSTMASRTSSATSATASGTTSASATHTSGAAAGLQVQAGIAMAALGGLAALL